GMDKEIVEGTAQKSKEEINGAHLIVKQGGDRIPGVRRLEITIEIQPQDYRCDSPIDPELPVAFLIKQDTGRNRQQGDPGAGSKFSQRKKQQTQPDVPVAGRGGRRDQQEAKQDEQINRKIGQRA